MRALEFITGHVIYNPAYTYKFQLKTTLTTFGMQLANANVKKKLLEMYSKSDREACLPPKNQLPSSINQCKVHMFPK